MVPLHTSYFRPPIAGPAHARTLPLLLRGVLVRESEGRGARAAVLDWDDELDRRLYGIRHLRGLLQRLWVLKLRARGSTSENGQTWWAGVCVPALDMVGMGVVEETWV